MWMLPAYLLLPLAGGLGWYFAKKDSRKSYRTSSQLHQDYFRGLNYLINEQPDQAVDVFINLLEVDADTVEMHLALGNLFRRRGEVDRAIRIHQNLIARPQLEKAHRLEALSALGEDYFSAGVLDRAEKLFLELVRLGGDSQRGLRFLLMIYQQEKEWEKAIETAKNSMKKGSSSMQSTIAQFYCELALQMKEKKKIDEARDYLKRAQQTDKQCVRASLLQGELALQLEDYPMAIRYYNQVRKQDPAYTMEVIFPVVQCYQKLNDDQQLKHFLIDALHERSSYAVVLALSNYLQRTENTKAAIIFLASQIKQNPSLRGLNHLVELYLLNSSGDAKEKLTMLKNLIDYFLAEKPLYQCGQCGFSTQSLLWLCPSCHHWGAIKPIEGLEGV